jgi:hypothetical protein
METYKLRAEALIDIFNLTEDERFIATEYEIKKEKFYDITFTFDSVLSLEEIVEIIHDVKDGHVMLYTIKPLEEYTGEIEVNL